jgi:hypothetical protein
MECKMSGNYVKWIVSGLTLACATIICSVALAAQPCDAVDTNLSSARKQEYAALVVGAVTARIKPSAVKFRTFMESGAWSAVYVSTPVGDDGVFFFQDVNGQKQFKEVWGGWADPSERPDLIKWARKLGAAHVAADTGGAADPPRVAHI